MTDICDSIVYFVYRWAYFYPPTKPIPPILTATTVDDMMYYFEGKSLLKLINTRNLCFRSQFWLFDWWYLSS